LPGSMPMDLQMASDKGWLAVPLKTFTICNLIWLNGHQHGGERRTGL
jgi:hypothetical protein